MEYSTFNDVQHKPLRAYNRAVTFFNIFEDIGKAAAEDYAKSFSEEEKLQMIAIIKLVKKHGVKHVVELVTKGAVFPENLTDEEILKVTA